MMIVCELIHQSRINMYYQVPTEFPLIFPPLLTVAVFRMFCKLCNVNVDGSKSKSCAVVRTPGEIGSDWQVNFIRVI